MDFRVTDADAHYFEVIDDLTPYVDRPWKQRIADTRNLLPGSTGSRTVYGRITRELTDYQGKAGDPEDIPKIMAELGFDNILMLSQKMLNFGSMRADDERMVVLANAITDFMLDRVLDPAKGVYSMIPAPYRDPEATVELIERVGDEKAIVGVCLITKGPEPPLGNRRYEPIYELCEAKGLPINFHGGGAGLDQFHIAGYEKFLETHTLGFLFNNVAQLTSLVVQGVPVKFPDLDIIFQESGLMWIPMIMARLDGGYLKRQSEAPLLEKRPSEYIKEFYFGTQPLDHPAHESLQRTVETIGGPDQLMYASDYPHWDYDDPAAITDLGFLSDAEKQRILSGTAEAVLGI